MKRLRAKQGADSCYQRIYAAVMRIPRGRVSTYGGIARLAGQCGARQVGYAMAALPEGTRVPWHRVINRRGEISCRRHGDGASEQRERLKAEGVHFDLRGRVNLKKFGWHPL